MIASRFRRGFRCMATLAIDHRRKDSLTVPQRIRDLPKQTSKFKHDHRSALGIHFYGASSPAEIVSGVAPGKRSHAPGSMASLVVSKY